MTLGILGGLGPIATAYFMELLIQMTKAEKDQDHLQMIIYNMPQIPDRTAYILGKSEENPVDEIIRLGKQLAVQGQAVLLFPVLRLITFMRNCPEKFRFLYFMEYRKPYWKYETKVFNLSGLWLQMEPFKVVFFRKS